MSNNSNINCTIHFGNESAAVLDILGKPLILHQIETLSKFDEDEIAESLSIEL